MPLFALVRRLAQSSPSTCFSFINSEESNRSISAKQLSTTFDNIRVYQVWDGTPVGQPFTGSHFEAIELFLKASPGNFEKVIKEAEENIGLDMCCLISDSFLWFACDLAEKRAIPWVSFWTAAACSLSAHVYTNEILKTVASQGEHDETLSLILPGLPHNLEISDLPAEIFADKNPTPLALTLNNMVDKLPKSTAIVLNSFEEIEPIVTKDLKSKFKHYLNIGPNILSNPTPTIPTPDDDKNGCISWLDQQLRPRSVVYISFGTVIVPPGNELRALAEALEESQLPFLWSLRALEALPEGFLQRTEETGQGKIVTWAPQQRVLGHLNVGAFVTHCGWNSIMESIAGCVPMICRPFFGDQKLNSRMVEDSWRIGVRVEGGVFKKAETREAFRRVLSSEEGKAIGENVRKLKEEGVEAVGANGSSTKNFDTLLGIVSGKR